MKMIGESSDLRRRRYKEIFAERFLKLSGKKDYHWTGFWRGPARQDTKGVTWKQVISQVQRTEVRTASFFVVLSSVFCFFNP